eukprot:5836381-Pyramimonas_sp.AAC.1
MLFCEISKIPWAQPWHPILTASSLRSDVATNMKHRRTRGPHPPSFCGDSQAESIREGGPQGPNNIAKWRGGETCDDKIS